MNKEFKKIKNDLIKKAFLEIILYIVIFYIVIVLFIDGIFNDFLANNMKEWDSSLYYFFVCNKSMVLIVAYIGVLSVAVYRTVSKCGKYIEYIINGMDSILKDCTKEIKLPDGLISVENKLNKMRVDLITSQNEAREAEQKKNDLIMYMAHDLKTPLTSVIGYLTLISDETEISPDLQRKYIGIALNKANRVEELTNQFFDITRFNMQNIILNKKSLNLSYLLRQLIEECYPMLEKKRLKCVLKASDEIEFYGDGDKLARAFDNLLKNAINYSYENSEIEIICEESEKEIKICFRNKGDKIPEYKLDKIFEKFYRGDEARTGDTGGAGLGLAITKQIIDLHGGSISVKNNDEYIEFYILMNKSL